MASQNASLFSALALLLALALVVQGNAHFHSSHTQTLVFSYKMALFTTSSVCWCDRVSTIKTLVIKICDLTSISKHCTLN